MSCTYEVNVARRIAPDTKQVGPYFTQHFRIMFGRVDPSRARELAREIAEKYPEPDYRIQLSRWDTYGVTVDFEAIEEMV